MKQYETIVLKGVNSKGATATAVVFDFLLSDHKQDCLALLVVEGVLIPILRTAVASEFQHHHWNPRWKSIHRQLGCSTHFHF
jgi:hypothetical protein